MQHKIIAICGLKRSGKDTVANYFVQRHNYKHVKIADPLKQVCKILFGFSDEQIESNAKDEIDKRHQITPRLAMQFFGTEIMQYKIQEILPNTGRNFWINLLLDNISESTNPIVISDMRFMHEYNAIQKKYGDNAIIIKIKRDQHNTLQSEDNHCSEQEYLDIPETYLIENNSSIQELYEKLDLIKAYNPRASESIHVF
jgi:dephospho-CoA kinase